MHNIKVKFDKTIPFDGNTMFKEISDDYIGLFYVYLEYFYNGYNKHKPIYIGSSIKAKNIKYAIITAFSAVITTAPAATSFAIFAFGW